MPHRGDRKRRGSREMSTEKLQAIMRAAIQDAKDYRDELSDLRIKTNNAYRGKPYGNEVEGRSQIVTREVRDAVMMAMPSLMRILFGSHQVMEFAARHPDHVQFASDATAFILDAINNVNDGYGEFRSAVEDSLIRKNGVLKAWWEESDAPVKTHHTGLTQQEVEILAADDSVTIVEATVREESFPAEVDEDEGPLGEPEQLFDVEVTRNKTEGQIRFMAVPPEEVLINRDARSFRTGDFDLVAHARVVPRSDLVEMGYDKDLVEDLSGEDEDDGQNDFEKESRSIGSITTETTSEVDSSMQGVFYAECWVKVDFDGDGIAELRRICVGGTDFEILENELVEFSELVSLAACPIAHQAIGDAFAGLVEDIQRIKTVILRNTIDSLAQHIHPDMELVEGQVNFSDALDTSIGRTIRVKQPGMIRYLSAPFVGDSVFPVLQHLDTLAESRTGMNEAAQGLNADALQSTARAAIENAVNSANDRIEYIARTFVESGLKDFFKLLLRIAQENVDRPQWVRMNRRFQQVDPRSWNVPMDVTTTIALGSGTVEQRIATLRELATKQEMAIQTGGPDNPVAGLQEYRNTLAEIVKLSGLMDVDKFLKNPDDQPPIPEPGPTPEEILAESESKRQEHAASMEERKFMLDAWKAMQQDDRERDRNMADFIIRAEKARADGVNIDINAARLELEREREGHQFLDSLIQDLLQQEQIEQQAQAAQQQQQQQQQMGGGNV